MFQVTVTVSPTIHHAEVKESQVYTLQKLRIQLNTAVTNIFILHLSPDFSITMKATRQQLPLFQR